MTHTLSEYESKVFLAEHGITIPEERFVRSAAEAAEAADQLGYPVVVKLCGHGIAHKTERNLVRLSLGTVDDVLVHGSELLGARKGGEDGAGLLVQSMVRGSRELIAGLVRDPQFGPCVMLGLGGIFAEALADVVFAVAPLEPGDAESLIDSLEHRQILGPFRGEPEVDRAELSQILEGLGTIGVEHEEVVSIDVNPLIVRGAQPMVVDALVELEGPSR